MLNISVFSNLWGNVYVFPYQWIYVYLYMISAPECKVCPSKGVISLYYPLSTATDYLRFAILSETKDIFEFESVIEKRVQVVSSKSNK